MSKHFNNPLFSMVDQLTQLLPLFQDDKEDIYICIYMNGFKPFCILTIWDLPELHCNSFQNKLEANLANSTKLIGVPT